MRGCHEALRQVHQRSEIVRCEKLLWDNREIDFYLVEPAGMNELMNDNRIAVPIPESLGCRGALMRRTAADDPEDAPCTTVGTARHDLIHEAIKGCQATMGFASMLGRRAFGPRNLTKIVSVTALFSARARRLSSL